MFHDSQLTDALDSLPQNKRMFITNNHQVLLASAIGSRNHAAFFQELWGSIFAAFQPPRRMAMWARVALSFSKNSSRSRSWRA